VKYADTGPTLVWAVLTAAPAPATADSRGAWCVMTGLLGILYLVVEPLRVLRDVRAAPTPAPEVTGG
jgi:hypothetical protein